VRERERGRASVHLARGISKTQSRHRRDCSSGVTEKGEVAVHLEEKEEGGR
jgi:hypothetical protein